jgi:WD40 repeat protein
MTASADGTVRVWDIHSGEQRVSIDGQAQLMSAAYNHQGSHLVTASRTGTARVWVAATGVMLAELVGHGGAIHAAPLQPG